MTDDPVMLELHLLRDDMARFHREVGEQFDDVKQRLGKVERSVPDLRHGVTDLHQGLVRTAIRLADLDRRLDRVEQHLSQGT